MKKTLILLAFCALSNLRISAYEVRKIYDSFAQFYLSAPTKVDQGSDFTISVTFRQTSTTFPFNKNGDMYKTPSFPHIEGLDRLGQPEVLSNVEESKNEGKVVSKSYSSTFFYKMNAAKAGVYKISGVKMVFRGHLFNANEEVIEVTPKESTSDTADNESDSDISEEATVYNAPFVRRKSQTKVFVESIKVYSDRTEVDLSYTSIGENVWVSSETFLVNSDTKEKLKLRTVRGDVGFERRSFGTGEKLNYTLIFPAIEQSWREVNLLENVSGGFSFWGIGLASQLRDNVLSSDIRKQIETVNWRNMRKVELNNYSSDFLFTDGLVPIYNKDTYKWGFFDEKGNQVIPFIWDYDDYQYPHFGGGYCIVSKKMKENGYYRTDYFSINRAGQPVKLNGVKKVTPFCDGYAAVVKQDGKYTYIKGNGNEAFPALNRYIGNQVPRPARPFVDGLSAYYDYAKKKYGFINKQGGLVIAAVYEAVHDFSEGLAAVKVPATDSDVAKWGFIDKQGKMVIPAQYTYEPSLFRLGRAVVVKRSGMQVMIDKKGEIVSPEFSDLFPFFSTGFTLAELKDSQGYFIINNDYRVVAGPIYGVDSAPLSYKDSHGAFQTSVLGPGYSASYVYLTTGEPLFKDPSWKSLGRMSENLMHFEGKDGHGFIDYEGNVIFQFVQSEF